MSLVVFGTIALDDVKTPSGVRKDMLGGSAAHFSMSARLFSNIHLVGVVGKDFLQAHLELFKRKKINIESLRIVHGPSFHWEGEYKQEDFNTALTRATELGVLVDYVPQITNMQRNIKNLFLANYDAEIQMKMLQLMKNPHLVGLDSMNLWIELQKKPLIKLIKKVNLFVLNDGEARMLTGETNLIKAIKALKRMGPQMIILKKGEHGVVFLTDQFMFSFPAYPVEKVVDPTGAGDTFAGGVMGYLSSVKKINQTTLKKAAIYATVLSSFNVESFGMSKTQNLTLVEVNKRAKKFIKYISPPGK